MSHDCIYMTSHCDVLWWFSAAHNFITQSRLKRLNKTEQELIVKAEWEESFCLKNVWSYQPKKMIIKTRTEVSESKI